IIFFFFFPCYGHPRDLHSFPTRRSSDLKVDEVWTLSPGEAGELEPALDPASPLLASPVDARRIRDLSATETERSFAPRDLLAGRSEEHTSELQSRSDLVCRLLLEKKKKY